MGTDSQRNRQTSLSKVVAWQQIDRYLTIYLIEYFRGFTQVHQYRYTNIYIPMNTKGCYNIYFTNVENTVKITQICLYIYSNYG